MWNGERNTSENHEPKLPCTGVVMNLDEIIWTVVVGFPGCDESDPYTLVASILPPGEQPTRV